jgi:hypothetical protein
VSATTRLLTGVALAGVVALVAGCSPAAPTASTPASAETTPAPSATASTPDAGGAAALNRLVKALDALSAGYRFDTSVTVGGTVATRAAGRWAGGTSEFDVTSAGATITYRTVPPNAWVKGSGGTWTRLDGAPAGSDPLAALRVPADAVLTSGDPGASGAASLQLRYPATAFGLTGDDVAATMTITADGSIEVAYQVTMAGAAAETITRLVPDPTGKPLTAPGG